MVGVEVAVHTDCVFVDRRIAAGAQPVEIEKIVRNVYRVAGYGGPWKPEPGKIRVMTDFCQEKLSAEESDIRPSDDQNIVIGYACASCENEPKERGRPKELMITPDGATASLTRPGCST